MTASRLLVDLAPAGGVSQVAARTMEQLGQAPHYGLAAQGAAESTAAPMRRLRSGAGADAPNG